MASEEDQQHRGRDAAKPQQIPRSGWRDILLRVKGELTDDNVGIIAAGVAFYALFAIFPALAALVSIYGLFADPVQVEQQFAAISGILPQEGRELLITQLKDVTASAQDTLGFGAVLGIFFALWSAKQGINALITALNIIYDEQDKRGFIKGNLLSLTLTASAVVFGVVVIGLVVGVPALLGHLGSLGNIVKSLIAILQWPILAVLVIVALAVIYRLGPDRSKAQWKWITPGAMVATILWIIGSILFSLYVANFGDYNKTYGSMGAIIILMTWFYLSAYVVLLGAEINAELEHQTKQDTTTGRSKPMGERGAYVADTVGEKP